MLTLLEHPSEKEGHGPRVWEPWPPVACWLSQSPAGPWPMRANGGANRYDPGFHPFGMIRVYGHSILVQYPS